jgi:hypothetical protein
MAKSLTVTLEESEAIWLYQILLDRDPEEALAFVQRHLRKPVEQFVKGGCREAMDQASRKDR